MFKKIKGFRLSEYASIDLAAVEEADKYLNRLLRGYTKEDIKQKSQPFALLYEWAVCVARYGMEFSGCEQKLVYLKL